MPMWICGMMKGMGFRVHSVQGDTVSLQNIDVEIRRIRLDEITSVLPYFPEITGLFSAEAHYIQTKRTFSSLQKHPLMN